MGLLPFRWLPASWGLVGDPYEEAKAHYELRGEALARRLLKIRCKDERAFDLGLLDIEYQYGHISEYEHAIARTRIDYEGDELASKLLSVDVLYGKISPYDAQRQTAEILPPGLERDLALLAVEHDHGKLTDNAYEKACATLRNEPWIAIINSGFDPEQGIDGVFFEFDWNPPWIEFLKVNGYIGHTDEQIVDDWFTDVCRSYASADILPFPKDFGLP